MRATAVLSLIVAVACFAPATLFGAEEEDEDRPDAPRSILEREGSAPRFSLHGFGDVTVTGERIESSAGGISGTSAFALGELDLFITSRLARNISFFTETVFEQDDEGQGVVDVERFWLKYSLSDYFWISIGRHHTPLGIWNQSFHHGLLLQPTVERPEALRFEDDERGGFLPVHSVGVEAGGRLFHGVWRFDYTGGISNGRDLDRSEVQTSSDLNDHKAFALKLSFFREGNSQLQFGPVVYRDDIPADPATPGRAGEIEEQILGASFRFLSNRLDLLAEYYHVRHRDEATAAVYTHPAYIAVITWRDWKWKPYAGMERLRLDAADPFYVGLVDLQRILLGVRLDINPFNALKLEYRHDHRPGETFDVLAAQVAFTF